MSYSRLATLFSAACKTLIVNRMSHPGNNDLILRKAFEGIIAVLGPEGEKAIISELRGRCDYESEYLDFRIVQETLERLFGPNSAELLLEQVAKVETRLKARIVELKNARR